jgi:hypothetical protein
LTFTSSTFILPGEFASALTRGYAFIAYVSTASQVAGFSFAKESSSEDFSLLLNIGEEQMCQSAK